MTKLDLARKISGVTGSIDKSMFLINFVLKEITRSLAKGRTVRIHKFGIFNVKNGMVSFRPVTSLTSLTANRRN
jgi:nucleoid DNA-binding protein